MIINKANLNILFTGFNTAFQNAFAAAPIVWDKLAMRAVSTGEKETYGWLGAVPGMKEIMGEIQIQNLALHDYTIKNKEWSDVVPVKELNILSDKYGIYTPLFARLGEAGKQHPDELVANLLLNGFTNLAYTGVPFFAANHTPIKGKGSFSNTGTAVLSAESFSAARASIRGRLSPDGRALNLGRKLTLVVSPQNESLAKQILKADFVAITKGNTTVGGVSNVNKDDADIVVLPQLAAQPAKWFLLDTGSAIRPLIVQFLQDVKLSSLTSDDSDHVFKRHEFLYQAYGVYNAGYGLPEMAYGSTGAA
jgi:phage major head subunit gpT-like protein